MITYQLGKCNGWVRDGHETNGALTLIRFLPGWEGGELLELVLCAECLDDIKAGQLYKLGTKLGLVEIKAIEDVDAQPMLL